MKSQNTRGVRERCKRSNVLIGAIYLSGVFPITLKDLKHILRSAIRETVKVVPMGGLGFFPDQAVGIKSPSAHHSGAGGSHEIPPCPPTQKTCMNPPFTIIIQTSRVFSLSRPRSPLLLRGQLQSLRNTGQLRARWASKGLSLKAEPRRWTPKPWSDGTKSFSCCLTPAAPNIPLFDFQEARHPPLARDPKDPGSEKVRG